jgi:hypothetical protein
VRDIIATFGRVLGREVRYEEISDEEWRRDALARGINRHAVEHLSHLWRALRTAGRGLDASRSEITNTIEKVGGAKPKSCEEFVREEQDAFMDALRSKSPMEGSCLQLPGVASNAPPEQRPLRLSRRMALPEPAALKNL